MADPALSSHDTAARRAPTSLSKIEEGVQNPRSGVVASVRGLLHDLLDGRRTRVLIDDACDRVVAGVLDILDTERLLTPPTQTINPLIPDDAAEVCQRSFDLDPIGTTRGHVLRDRLIDDIGRLVREKAQASSQRPLPLYTQRPVIRSFGFPPKCQSHRRGLRRTAGHASFAIVRIALVLRQIRIHRQWSLRSS